MDERSRPPHPSARRSLLLVLATLLCLASVAVSACGDDGEGGDDAEQDGGPQAALLEYLPAESGTIASVDLVQARKDLKLPADADPFEIDSSATLREKLESPNLQLTLIAADGFNPLAVQLVGLKTDKVTQAIDGSAIQQAASNRLDLQLPVSAIRTTQPFDEIAKALSADYERNGDTLIARDPSAQVNSIADAGDGIVVFAGNGANAEDVAQSPPGGPPALTALLKPADEPDSIASTPSSRSESCITAFGGWNAPDGSGTMAMSIEGGANEDAFDPVGLQGAPVDLGDPTFDGDRIEVPMTRNNGSLATSGNILDGAIRGKAPLNQLYDCG